VGDRLFIGEVLNEGLEPAFPIGCGDIFIALPTIMGAPLLSWLAVKVRPTRTTAASLTDQIIQYATPFDCKYE
jgi:hypothetical protein